MSIKVGGKRKQLDSLIDPKEIALIGASKTDTKVGGILFKRLLNSNRKLFPVNPNETHIQGHVVYPDIDSLPSKIDLAIIALAAPQAVKAVENCIKKCISNYIIIAGGFGETDEKGKLLEQQLASLAKKNNINILGPNSLGIFLPDENIDTIFVEHGDTALERNGHIACIVQSGSVGTEALGYAANTGYGMRAFVGLGNKCDLDETDFLRFFWEDKKTNCLGFYLESIDKGREFLSLARQVSQEKPVVVLKTGMTHTAASAVTSHTGKLAGSDKVITGAFRQHGIQRVYDDEEFCDTTKILSMLPPAQGNRVAVLTGAGGYGVMAADLIESKRPDTPLKMAKLSDQTQEKIRETTFLFASCENPVDITASADDDMFSTCLDALIQDNGVDIILCVAFFSPPGISIKLMDIITEKTSSSSKPIIVFTKYGPFTDNRIKNFYHSGVVAFPSISRAVRAARSLVQQGIIQKKLVCSNLQSSDCSIETNKKQEVKNWLMSFKKGKKPDEFDSKQLIQLYDIPVPQSFRMESDSILEPKDLTPPLVVKVCSPQILHKTDQDGVILNLDKTSVQKAIVTMKEKFPDQAILVEEQIDFQGPEFIVGLIKDPVMGPAVMVGTGGIYTEIYKDSAFRLAPCSLEDAMEMIDELTISSVFDNFRGMILEKKKLAQIVSSVSMIANDLSDKFEHIEINPIVYADGQWVALDANIYFGQYKK